MLRMPQRAKYCKCASLVGALWHPSFMRAGVAAAQAFRGARLLPTAMAEAPEEARNFLRFIGRQYIARRGFGGSHPPRLRKKPLCSASTCQKFPGISTICGNLKHLSMESHVHTAA